METLRFLMISTHFPPHHLGGDAVFVEYLSRGLADRGHEVHVLHNPTVHELIRRCTNTHKNPPTEDGIHRHVYEPRLRRTEALTSLMHGLWSRQKRTATSLFREIDPDVVHWHNTRAFIGQPFVFNNEVPLYTCHDYGAVCPRSNLLKPNLEMCTKPSMCTICCLKWRKPPQIWRISSRRVREYPAAMKVIAPSEFIANRLRDDGIRCARIIRNFVPDPGEIRPSSCSSPDSLVYLGMLEAHKGLHTLVRAFAKSANEHGFVLDIIGTGSLRHELTRTISSSRLNNRVRLHGFLSRKDAELLRCRAVAQIVPSEWYENCPLTILEALAMGVPVIGADSGGIPEIVGLESGSKLFKCGDASALAETMTQTWGERGDMTLRRKKARHVYTTRFKPDFHLDEYMRLINDSS